MVDQGKPELLGEGCSRCVVHRGGEGHEDRVPVEREDNPPDLQKCGLVVDRATEESSKLCGQAFLLDLDKGETLQRVLHGGGVQGVLCFLCDVCEVVYCTIDEDEESSRCYRGVALMGCMSDSCVVVEDVDGDEEGGLNFPGFVLRESVIHWMVRKGCGDPE